MRRLVLCLLAIPAACGCPSSDPPPPRSVPKSEPNTYRSYEETRPRRLPVDGPIRRGPYVQAVTPTETIICFETIDPVEGKVECSGKTSIGGRTVRHEVEVRGLKPGTRYPFTIQPGGISGSFKTALDG